MADKTPRNAPCPCGSGKKHKNCCLGKTQIDKRDWLIPMIVSVLGVAGGIVVIVTHSWKMGASVAGGSLILAALIGVLRKPPPPSGDGNDPAGLNFGG